MREIEIAIHLSSNSPPDEIRTSRILRPLLQQFLANLFEGPVTMTKRVFSSIHKTILHDWKMIIQRECGICLEPILLYSRVQIPLCRHGFHHDCMNRVLEHGFDSCPVCRQNFS